MEGPLVSVVIPSYDRPDTLERAIRTVLNQTYDNIEIIIVETPPSENSELEPKYNDTDGTPITHIHTPADVNSLEARNIGMRRADGKYIAFLDDDDEWLPEKTVIQVEELLSSPSEIGASVTGNRKIGPDGDERNLYVPPRPDNTVKYQLCWNIGTFSMLMIHSAILDTVGFLDEEIEGCADQDFLVRIAQEYDFAIVDSPLVLKHADDQPQLSESYEKRKNAHKRFRQKYSNLASNLGIESEMEAALEFSLGRVALKNSEYQRARKHFLESIKNQQNDQGYYVYYLIALGGPILYPLGKTVKRYFI